MNVDFNTFEKQIKIIQNEIANKLRERYTYTFINTENEHYKKHILTLKLYSDGLCYSGYLWECLINPVVIRENEVFDFLCNYSGNVYVFWDIHSKDKILTENYWRFDKNAVLEFDSKLLIENCKYLPEDIYVFDDSFEWTYILTHEDKDGCRICAKI